MLDYRDGAGEMTRRKVLPLALLKARDGGELLEAWCELRKAPRHFRLGRVLALSDPDTGELLTAPARIRSCLVAAVGPPGAPRRAKGAARGHGHTGGRG